MLKKTNIKIKRVAFFGDADIKARSVSYRLAFETAYLLAKEGFIIVNGGGPGIMRASTEGAKLAKGKVDLVIIDPKKEPGNYEGSDKNNLEYANKIYMTNSIEQRVAKLVEIADAFVIFRGGTGTLAEVGLVWELAKFNFGHHEPLIFVGKEWEEVVPVITRNLKFEAKEKEVYKLAETPKEVLRALTRVENLI